MKKLRPDYELPIHGVAWTAGIGAPAGVFFLDGHCHFAAFASPAAGELQARGALHLATVRFDAAPAPGPELAQLRPIAERDAVRHFAPGSRN